MSSKNVKKPVKKPAAKKPAAKAKPSKPAAKKPAAKKPAKKSVKPKKKKSLAKTSRHVSTDKVSYLFTERGVTVTFPWTEKGKVTYRTKTVTTGTPEFDEVRTVIRQGKPELIVKAMTRPERLVQRNISRFREKSIELRDGALLIDGVVLPTDLGKRIVTYAEQGIPYDSLVKFWKKLVQNPSRRAVQGLFRFLNANHFPITEDGDFLAYRGVTANWKDPHTQTMDNSIGSVVEMPRNQVDEDPNVACSAGLHVAAHSYALGFMGNGGHTIVVSVNPCDVVSVPFADSDQKMRVCKFVVLSESFGELSDHVVDASKLSSTASGMDADEDEVDEEDLDPEDDGEDDGEYDHDIP